MPHECPSLLAGEGQAAEGGQGGGRAAFALRAPLFRPFGAPSSAREKETAGSNVYCLNAAFGFPRGARLPCAHVPRDAALPRRIPAPARRRLRAASLAPGRSGRIAAPCRR